MEDKVYSQMTENELRAEIARLKEKARKAEQLGIVNEFAVYERRALMAAAYLIDPATIIEGDLYRINTVGDTFFKVDKLKGRFAWGYRLGSDQFEEALPISMLTPVKDGK